MSHPSDETPAEPTIAPVVHEESSSPRKMNLKKYFDEKLHPKLSAALNACAVERPDDPIAFVGNYLLAHPEKRI